jgi:hypothetical protein
MQLPTEEALMRHVREFCEAHDIRVSEFGKRAVGDLGFMTRLKNGRSPTLRTARRAYLFMANFGKSDGDE